MPTGRFVQRRRVLSLPTAKRLVMVFNHGNVLHNNPKGFRLLTTMVIGKRDKEKELRFPHIHAVVYFVKSAKENMNFWIPVVFRHDRNDDVTRVGDLQKECSRRFICSWRRSAARK